MLKEFASFVADKTSFVKGSTLQVGFRPTSAPDRCNVIIESVGGESFFDMPHRVDQVFQILSRSERGKKASIWQARDDAWEIFNTLTANLPGLLKSSGWDLPVVDKAYIAMIIEAVASPQYIGYDEQGRFEYSTNYIVKIRDA